jgi:outer membrane protein TolC
MSEAQRSTLLFALFLLIPIGTLPAQAQIIRRQANVDHQIVSNHSGLGPGEQCPRSNPTATDKRAITVNEAVSIFLRQNFELIAARYDIDSAEAEKLTARLRPNPRYQRRLLGLATQLSGNLLTEQEYSYSIAQTFELGGKRAKRINVANANSDLARAQFEMAVWQLTNDVKRKFFTVILNRSLLELAQENEKTFAETVKHTEELVQAGELAGLDLTRLEVESLSSIPTSRTHSATMRWPCAICASHSAATIERWRSTQPAHSTRKSTTSLFRTFATRPSPRGQI